MSDVVIRVEGLSKQYRIGARRERHDTLRDHIASTLKSLFRPNGHNSVPRNADSMLSDQQADASDTFWALRDVSFEVKQGEVLGIIGRNGAGKSTLLKILSRITEPTSGRIEIDGRVASLLEVGTGFHPELTGRENIYLNGTILGMKKTEIDRKFDEIIAFAEIEKFLDTPVKRYSSGMYVRLAFAVAAHLEPDILIVDEVLTVGDVGFQKKCLGKMEKVTKEGRTVLLVSHNMAAVRSLCKRSVLLANGRLDIEGPSEKVIYHYLDQQQETGSEKMPARIEADRDYFNWIDGFSLNAAQGRNLSLNCGDPIILEFAVESMKELSEITVGITVTTATDVKVVSMSSKVQQVSSASGPSRVWWVSCDLGRLPLNAGTYFARVYVGNGDLDVARFSKAVTLHIRENDVFGWGNSLPDAENWGPLYWAPRWNIRPNQ